MPVNTSTILGGPALVQFRGATFYSKGNITLASSKETFNIDTDRFGKVDERVSDESLIVEFEPAGEFENLSVLWPFAATLLGSLVSPQALLVSAINLGTEQLTIPTGNGLVTADDVLVHVETGGVLPAATPALTQTTRYFVRVIDATTVQLHPTAADATNNTNAINFTGSGTGAFYLDRDWPLVIHTYAGIKLTLYNAAVVQMPALRLSAVQTLIGAVRFEAFLRNGTDWNNAAARWVIAAAALSDTSFNPVNILTQPYTAAWGAVAPWDSFQTKEGWEVGFNLGLAPVMTDALGVVTRRLTGLDVTARATPAGIDESQLFTKLLLQDAGAVRGRSLSGDSLNLSATGVYVRLYGAALKTAAENFSSGLERMGQLEWFATRTFAAGVPNPLFFVGTAAP
jgi:hypothetical protein